MSRKVKPCLTVYQLARADSIRFADRRIRRTEPQVTPIIPAVFRLGASETSR